MRTLYRSGNITIVAKEMSRRIVNVMSISEAHWTGDGEVDLAEEETIINSGRDDTHREGVGILMSKRAARALIVWTPDSERITYARYQHGWTTLQGITLLPVVGKVLGRIITDQIRSGINTRLRREQTR